MARAPVERARRAAVGHGPVGADLAPAGRPLPRAALVHAWPGPRAAAAAPRAARLDRRTPARRPPSRRAPPRARARHRSRARRPSTPARPPGRRAPRPRPSRCIAVEQHRRRRVEELEAARAQHAGERRAATTKRERRELVCERDREADHARRPRLQQQLGFDHHAERALAADEPVHRVVHEGVARRCSSPASGGAGRARSPSASATRERRDVRARGAVAQRARTAGVAGDRAADGALLLARRIGREEQAVLRPARAARRRAARRRPRGRCVAAGRRPRCGRAPRSESSTPRSVIHAPVVLDCPPAAVTGRRSRRAPRAAAPPPPPRSTDARRPRARAAAPTHRGACASRTPASVLTSSSSRRA